MTCPRSLSGLSRRGQGAFDGAAKPRCKPIAAQTGCGNRWLTIFLFFGPRRRWAGFEGADGMRLYHLIEGSSDGEPGVQDAQQAKAPAVGVAFRLTHHAEAGMLSVVVAFGRQFFDRYGFDACMRLRPV